MHVNEQDLEQLELYLDNELTPDQAGAVEVRCLAEPALGAQLAKLREDRSVRLAAMSSTFDTDAASVERLVASVRMAQVNEAFQLKRKATGWWPSRSILTAAASLAFGLFLGVTLQKQHGNLVDAPVSTGSTSTGSFIGNNVGMGNQDLQGHGAFVVVLRDGEGREIFKHAFNSREEAEQFIARVSRPGGMPVKDAKVRDEPY